MLLAKSLLVLRPYHASIRGPVSEVLRTLGFDVEHAVVEERGTPSVAILAALRVRPPPDAMLVPFNAQKDANGDATDGLTLLAQVRRELPRYASVPVFMPVSQVAQAAFQLRLAGLTPEVTAHLHPIPEKDLLDPPAAARRLLDWLAAEGSVMSAARKATD